MQKLKSPYELPGKFGSPWLGELYPLLEKRELFYWEKFEQYGRMFKTHILGRKIVNLVEPDANRLVLLEKADHLSSRLGWSFLEPLFGQAILLQDGEEHVRTRRLMYPAFHGRALTNYFDTIEAIAQSVIQDWVQRGTMPLMAEFRNLTLTVATRLFMGVQTISEVEQVSQWFTELMNSTAGLLSWDVPFTLYGRGQNARRNLIAFLRNIVAERQRQGNLHESKDVLGLLLAAQDEEGNKLSDEQVINEALLLLFAGHETTASLLTWTLFELAAHPEWRERLRQEQTQVVGNDALNLSHLKQFSQLTNVLKESERLYPPVYRYSRGVIKDIEYAGYLIPAGWIVTITPMLTHRLPEIYPDPDSFDPDRFAPPREEDKKHQFTLLGFGGGLHGCLGFEFAQMEMKIVLSTLLRNYDWSITPEPQTITPVRKASIIQDTLKANITSV